MYPIDRGGAPRRLGMTAGHEFSDHVVEEQNYPYLAHSELLPCALGPELALDAPFSRVEPL